MTTLYLDTEFNSHGGELLSHAMAGSDGQHFYGVLAATSPIDPWVAENVIPHLGQEPEPMNVFRKRLHVYLEQREGSTIYADWPADFEHLTRIMCGGSYTESWMIECSMQLLRSAAPEPEQPHNALSDAIALMVWHNQTNS